MTKHNDPLGKRALFSAPAAQQKEHHGPLDVTVYCSGCDATTTLSPSEFLVQRLPFSAWIPLRKHSHYMRCPGCHQLTWMSVRLA